MAQPDDTKRARQERAKRLQEDMGNLPSRPPKSPREFIDQKMRELDKIKKKSKQK